MIKTHQINIHRALAISNGLGPALQQIAPSGSTPVSEVEFAILLTYCMVAQGVREYPEATRLGRAIEVCVQSSKAICNIIEAIGRQSDDEFFIRSTEPSNKIPA